MQLYSEQDKTPQILAVAPYDDQLTHTCDLFLRQGNIITTLGFKYIYDDSYYHKEGVPMLVHWNLKTRERSYQPLTLFTGELCLWADDNFCIEASRLEGNTCTVVLQDGTVILIDITTGEGMVQGMIPMPGSGSFGTTFVIQDNFAYLFTIQDPYACFTSADLSKVLTERWKHSASAHR